MKKFIGGMVKDPERVDQPEGSYRDALNANLYYHKGAVVSEQGTTAFVNVGGFVVDNIIGQCPLKDGRIVLFFNYTVDNSSTCAISIADPTSLQNDIIYRNAQLNFQPSNTIEATSKIDVNGNILVYFTDNYLVRTTEPITGIEYISDFNPPRVINITRQLQSTSIIRLYDNADYTIDKLDIFMNAGEIPEFSNIKIEEGGGVVSGTYHLALAYVDEDLNRTNYLATSNPVHLVTEHEDAIPTESITGDPQGSQSNKSILWTVDIPLPSNYTHVQPVIIQRFGGGTNQSSSEFAYQLEIVKIPEADADAGVVSLEITYTGLEQIASASISEVVIDSVRYETAKTFVQLDNRLYMSNLRARGDIGYQRFANSIVTTPISTAVDRFDPKRFKSRTLNQGYSDIDFPNLTDDFETYKNWQSDTSGDGFFASNVRKGYKDVNMSYNYRGYRRSEIYSFYISFVLKDGSETYAYHIPGRSALNLPRAESGSTTVNEDSPLSAAVLSSVDTALGLNLEEFKDLYPDAKLYQVTDTQFILNEAGSMMSFWENEDERYPDSADFDRYTVNSVGAILDTGDIRDKRVRHHKMPPNKNLTHSFVDSLNSNGVNLQLFGDPTSFSGLALDEEVKILGVRFTNIPLPTFIKDQVQGFKIYYGKRTQQEKSIIGQSIVMPAWYEDPIAVTNRMTTAANGPYADAWFLRGQPATYDNAILKADIPGKVNRLKAFSVFTFHDFNLLKNKHTLSGASHIDVQKILTMRAWAGGNSKKPRNISGTYNKYFLDTDWINSTIGNETWYEWVDTGGGAYNTEQAVTGAEATPAGIANYYTSVLIAQRYNNPNYPNNNPVGTYNVADGEVYGYWLNNYRTHAVISPNSRTYITGSTLLKNTDSSAFKNADYLMHYAGESCIALGLVSGLPALLQHGSSQISHSTNPINWWSSAQWSSIVDPDEGPLLKDINVESNDSKFQAWPAVFLVNLCVYKNNVYKPFDQQKLVWTGYYQKVDSSRTKYLESTNTVYGGDTYISRHSFRTTSQDFGACFKLGDGPQGNANADNWSGNPFNLYSVNGADKVQEKRTVDPYATVFNFLCESDDLLGFRHQGDTAAGVTPAESLFWEASIAADVLFGNPVNDYTKSDNLLYMNNYSAVQDIKVTTPLPKKLFNPTFFPTRTIRSNVDDGSIQDKYRFFLALDYKDIPKNRGEITKVFTLGSILYLHTERSLFVTRGRQQLGLSDNTQAFVGSGDIFEQNPDEMIPTTEGYGGTDCQFAALTTRFGQFFVNRKDRRVYMMGESIEELSSLGMEKWFLDNLPYELESYIDLENIANFDAPTEFFGFTAAYDPKYKRIILSKRERVPTGALLSQLNGNISNIQSITGGFSFYNDRLGETVSVQFSDLTESGWTISYYPELKVWGSRHSYLPVIFANNQKEYYGLTNGGDQGNIWEHSNLDAPGAFYGTTYNFEFEYIDNTQAGASKIFTNIRYWADVVNINNAYPSEVDRHTSPGFTTFYTYNTHQVSGVRNIYYLNNARLVDRFWYINDFRDLSTQANNTAAVLANNQLNVQDDFNIGTTTSLANVSMFTEEGAINANYIDNNKVWYNQKKFVDHFMGVRLVSDNLTGNLIYLYAAGTKFRQSFR